MKLLFLAFVGLFFLASTIFSHVGAQAKGNPQWKKTGREAQVGSFTNHKVWESPSRETLVLSLTTRAIFSPMVIKDRDSTSFIIKPPAGVKSVQFKINGDLNATYYNGVLITDFVNAYDDGTHGDAIAGDSLFTLNHISLPPQFATGSPLLSSQILIVGTQFKLTWADSSVTIESPADLGHGLIVVNPEKTWNEPEVVQRSDSLFVSPRVANFVVDEKNLKVDYTEERSKYTTTFYRRFGDDYDFVFLGINHLLNVDRQVVARAVRTRTYEAGTWTRDFFPGDQVIPYDYNSILGSSGRLQSVVELKLTPAYGFNTVNHEILHNWCSYVFPISNNSGSRTGHWNLIERNTSGFGGPGAYNGIVTSIEHISGDTFRVAYNSQNPMQSHYYNDLELYMMGLGGIDEISFPVRMLSNARNERYENEVNGVLTELFEADSIANITKAQLLQLAGERIPGVTGSPKSFNVALVILSSEKLTPLEFAFYEKVMTMWEQDSASEQLTESPNLTFHKATGGRATIHALLNLNSLPVTGALPPFPVYPRNGATMHQDEFGNAVEWTIPFNASSYELQLAIDSAFANILYSRDSIVVSPGSAAYIAVPYSWQYDNTKYWWRVRAKNAAGTSAWSVASFTLSSTTGVSEIGGGVPREFSLSNNYPNPFNPTTTIHFTLPEDGRATLKIYDVLGREVATLFDGEAKAGYLQTATFNATRIASGIYFSRLEHGGKQLMKKMLLMK